MVVIGSTRRGTGPGAHSGKPDRTRGTCDTVVRVTPECGLRKLEKWLSSSPAGGANSREAASAREADGFRKRRGLGVAEKLAAATRCAGCSGGGEARQRAECREFGARASIVRYRFPARGEMPAVTLVRYDGGLEPERPAELKDDRALGEGGTLYRGDKGVIYNGRLLPESRMREYLPPPHTLARSPGHYQEWVNACKGGEAAGSNFDISGPQAETILLGNIALRTGKKLLCDSAALRITNVPEANALLRRQYRPGWGGERRDVGVKQNARGGSGS